MYLPSYHAAFRRGWSAQNATQNQVAVAAEEQSVLADPGQVWVVEDAGARRFYARHGFDVEDSVWMSRPLA